MAHKRDCTCSECLDGPIDGELVLSCWAHGSRYCICDEPDTTSDAEGGL